MKKIEKSNKDIRSREQKLRNFLNTLKQEDSITERYREYTEDIKQVVSDEEEIAKFLSEIEKLAVKTAISLADIKPGKVEETDRFKKYTVKVEVESQISALADFIYQLEKLPQLLRVEDFSMIPKRQGSNVLKISMTITQLLITEISAQEAKNQDESQAVAPLPQVLDAKPEVILSP